MYACMHVSKNLDQGGQREDGGQKKEVVKERIVVKEGILQEKMSTCVFRRMYLCMYR